MQLKSVLPFCVVAYGLLASTLFTACNNTSSDSTADSASDTSVTTNEKDELASAAKILYALPSPIEAATLLKMAGATFDKSILNPPSNVSKYVANDARALNLGVYSADLAFTNIFEQTQEAAEYLQACNKLATQLGVDGAFGEDIYNRIKSNMGNRDSLMMIVSDASLTADAYFKENERPGASALSAAGGWIEGLYIATRIALKTGNKEVTERVAEQKYALNDLLALAKSYPSEKDLAGVIADLTEIKNLYDGLQVVTEETTPDPNAEVPTIGGGKKIVMSKEQFNAICNKVEQVRNKITK